MHKERLATPRGASGLLRPRGGVNRKIPAGFLLGHDSIKGFVLVSPHEINSFDEIRVET